MRKYPQKKPKSKKRHALYPPPLRRKAKRNQKKRENKEKRNHQASKGKDLQGESELDVFGIAVFCFHPRRSRHRLKCGLKTWRIELPFIYLFLFYTSASFPSTTFPPLPAVRLDVLGRTDGRRGWKGRCAVLSPFANRHYPMMTEKDWMSAVG